MKSSERFKQTIKNYLDAKADRDSLFARTYAKENKNLDDCIQYMFNEIKRRKAHGFTDQEIYSMAVHYYDEDDVDIGGKVNMEGIVVNHQVQLTEEEIAEAKAQAKKRIENEAYEKMKKKPSKTKKENVGPAKELF